MFCAYCNVARVANEAPCPNCGAPSSLLMNMPQDDGRQQLIPYQSYQQANPMQLVPMQDRAQMVPTLPAPSEDPEIIYIQPLYTQPRPIIPQYRIISGFLSVLIVIMLMCTGAGYYAKTSGKFLALRRAYGFAPPPSLNTTATPELPDPPNTIEKGPAYAIIDSATTTTSIDSNHFAVSTERIFKPGKRFYVTYSVQHPKTKGVVVIKWYTNTNLYTSAQSVVNAGETINGDASMVYTEPAEGWVELYWNDQLAQKLYFVVR